MNKSHLLAIFALIPLSLLAGTVDSDARQQGNTNSGEAKGTSQPGERANASDSQQYDGDYRREKFKSRRERRQALLEKRDYMLSGNGIKSVENIQYVPGSTDPLQQMDLFVPRSGKKPFPVVVYIHGGAWHQGTRHTRLVKPLISRGFAVAAISYRLTPTSLWPAQLQDCKSAVRWLRAHANEYSLDSKRIGVWGESAGGHLAAMLGVTGEQADTVGGNTKESSAVQAVVDWFGPTDVVHLAEEQEHLPPDIRVPGKNIRQYVDLLLGGPVNQHLAAAKDASPISHVSGKLPPFLIVHGDHDPTVPLQQSKEFFQALKNNHVDASLRIVPNGGHGSLGLGPDANREAYAFLQRHLMAKSTKSGAKP